MFSLKRRSATHSVAGLGDLHVDRHVGTAGVRVVPPQGDAEQSPRAVIVEDGSRDIDELLVAVASGDQAAFATLERRIGGLVRVNIRRVLRDVSRSDAVTQEFFGEVPREVTDFDPDRDRALAWLLTRAHERAMRGLISGDTANCRTDRPLHLVAGSVGDLGHPEDPAA